MDRPKKHEEWDGDQKHSHGAPFQVNIGHVAHNECSDAQHRTTPSPWLDPA
jgi:hypothetical protein